MSAPQEEDDTPWWGHVLWFGGIVGIAILLGMVSDALGCGTGHSDADHPAFERPDAGE